MSYDPNDPVNKAELDAYVEHEKHEPIAEKLEDLSNRRSWWVLLMALVAALGGLCAIAKSCS